MKKTVYAYAHTHWDREWYRGYEEFRVRLVDVFDDVLEKLKRNEVSSFYFDGQTAAVEDYLQIRPENEELIKKFIKQKRLFLGPYYCSTDSFLVDSESLIRNLQIGLKKSKELGCEDFIAYQADTFGHSAQLPEIIKYFGIGYGIFWRGCGKQGKEQGKQGKQGKGSSEFVFNGLNSTYLIRGYFRDYFSHNLPPETIAKSIKEELDKIAKLSSDSILLPLGGDHLALADNLQKQIDEVNKHLDDYKIVLSTPFEYAKKVAKNFKLEKQVTEEQRDCSKDFILPGVLSSRRDLKQYNSRLQWELSRVTEPLQAIYSYLGKAKNYQSEIDYAYKTLIKNQAHDSIYGCGIDDVHKENVIRYKKISQINKTVKYSVLSSVINDVCDYTALNVMNLSNLSNYEYSGAVKVRTIKKIDAQFPNQLIGKTKGFPLKKIYNIHDVPVTEDYTDIYEYLIDVENLKPFSITKLDKPNIVSKSTLKVTKDSIENDKIAFCIKNKKITLFDKAKKKEYFDFIRIIDRADIGDSYNFGALVNDKKITAKIKDSKIIENGKVRCALKINFEIGIPKKSTAQGRSKTLSKHNIDMTVSLENQSEFLEFNLNWENKSSDHILQMEFNLEKPVKQTVSDDLTGLVKRNFNPNYNIYDHIPAPKGKELKCNTAPLQKFVCAQNLGLITEGLQEYEIFQNNLMLTLLRATGTISNPQNPTRGTPAGPPLPTPDLQMLGKNSARFAIALDKNTDKMFKLSERFYGCAVSAFSSFDYGQFFNLNNKNNRGKVLVNAIKTNARNDLVIRFVNKTNQPQMLDFVTFLPHKKIFIANALEEPVKEYKPFEVAANQFATLIIANPN